jgi:uncharacterized membrane protein YwaF
MTWGSFGLVHITTLVLAVLINIGLYHLLRHMKNRWQAILLGILSFSGIIALIADLVMWGSPIEYLPFHLCSINALILPFSVITRNKVLGNLHLLWCLGAIFALILNHGVADYVIPSPAFFIYYIPHILECGIPLIMLKLGLLRLDPRCIISTVVITISSYTAIHFVNIALNNYCIANNIVDYAGNLVQVNYMFSLAPNNPMLALFYTILPYQYWYMYLIIPVVIVYLGAIYGTHALVLRRRLKKQRAQEMTA